MFPLTVQGRGMKWNRWPPNLRRLGQAESLTSPAPVQLGLTPASGFLSIRDLFQSDLLAEDTQVYALIVHILHHHLLLQVVYRNSLGNVDRPHQTRKMDHQQIKEEVYL